MKSVAKWMTTEELRKHSEYNVLRKSLSVKQSKNIREINAQQTGN